MLRQSWAGAALLVGMVSGALAPMSGWAKTNTPTNSAISAETMTESAAAMAAAGEGYDVITVVGSREVSDIAGSVAMITEEDLAVQNYTDINRILRAVPGVNLQEEDGYGLRPNIGMRGSGSDRSSKVLIMEDGVPMAPAPFAAPSAYYFPNVARMSGIEITKNAGAVKYGPITTAGTVHFFSTPIPEATAGHLELMTSDLDRTFVHGWTGSRMETSAGFDVGFLLETYQDEARGFKKIDIGETGFSLRDYVAKVGFYSKQDAPVAQSLVLKVQHSEETSDETYLGLTQADFDRVPLARYNASQLDQMNTDHETYQASYNRSVGARTDLTALIYRTEFARNWEKLDRFNNSALSGLSACGSLNQILRDPALCAQEYQVLVGPAGYTSPDDVLGIRQNNRSYKAQGVQIGLTHQFDVGAVQHELTMSGRYHEDAVDRFQEQDQYRIENGFVVKTTDNAPGTQANRLSNAEARSLFVEDHMTWDALRVTAGLRYSTIKTRQRRWDTPDRTLAPDSVRENSYDVLLPALGLVYDVNDRWSVLASVAKGFAPPGPSTRASDGTDPERSIIYEAGGRYSHEGFEVEAIGFYSDYSNLLAECTNASGGSECTIGDNENAGKADVYGLETVARKTWNTRAGLSIPLSLVYTYTHTEFQSTVDSDIFGDITAGDEIPYVPAHQLTISGGLTGDSWGINGSLNRVSESRDQPGQGAIPTDQRVDARTIVDVAAYYEMSDGFKLHLKADNLFDETYIAARRPYGLRPGKPREIFAGVSIDF